MKVLITGVAGFIGSNLAAELLRRGHAVSGLDDFSQGSFLNLAPIAADDRFTFVKGDIRSEQAVARAARGCDAVVHLAAYKIPRYDDAYDTLMVNGLGSETVARIAARSGMKVVAASTSDVYGKNPRIPFAEDTDSVIGSPDVKRWAYAISKMFEEQLLFACHERFGIDVVLVRFFGGYGPNQSLSWWGGPQAVFIENALDGCPLPVHGDGSQSRSFTYVSDHVDGIISILESEHANIVVNIGCTEETTIRDLACLIWRLIHGTDDAPIEAVPYSSFGKYEDVRRRVPDLSRARDLFGFEPKIGLEDGLRRTIEWQVERRAMLAHAAAAEA
jgi:UDP-glucose 4-epimerase